MKRELKFTKPIELSDLEGLKINGATFKQGKGMYTGIDTIIMDIPDTFRFSTQLEIAEDQDNVSYLIMSQLLTRGAEMWEMEDAFTKIGSNTPEIEKQMRQVCDNLISRGLAEWFERKKEYFDKNKKLIEVGMKLQNNDGEVREVYFCQMGEELAFRERTKLTKIRYQVEGVEYFPIMQFDLDQWEIVAK